MQDIIIMIEVLNDWVWGPVMLVLILGTGLYLSIGLRFLTIRKIASAFSLLIKSRSGQGQGQISPFSALMTSLSATIGTGNIAGVATAIFLGGPGALFWMWMTALVGMATKYAEAVLAVKYREVDEKGNFSGGPMYYIKNGLGKNWHWLGVVFALFGTFAGFGIGNTVQSNSVSDALQTSLGIHPMVTGIGLMILVGLVILGGVKRIAAVASWLVPIMAGAYLVAGLVILTLNAAAIPDAIELIVSSAFTGTAAQGGFAGAAVWMAIRFGVARGIFSNEAGLGSAPIAHAAAKTDQPVKQGLIAMLGTFIDTLVVCSITGLVIVITGAWQQGVNGASLSALAFETAIPGGQWIVTAGLCLFAFTTILGWSYYGERCVVYLSGAKFIIPFRFAWVLAIPIGTYGELGTVWLIADTLNALMAIPNLIALLLLSPVVFSVTKAYFSRSE